MSKLKYANSLAWRMAIVLLIAVFCVAGVVSCSGAPTQSASLSSSGSGSSSGGSSSGGTTDGGTTDGGTTDGGTTDGGSSGTITPSSSYPADTYYTVHVPNATSAGWGATMKVSYQDQETLNKLWKAMMRRQGAKDGLINFIALRGYYNYSHDIFNKGQYCWFADNMDIYYKGSLMKKYRGAAIVPLKHNRNKYTVAGVYEMAINQSGVVGWISDAALHVFMLANDYRLAGDLELIIFDMDTQGRMSGNGVDVYYSSRNKGLRGVNWIRNIDNHLGQAPSWYGNDQNFNRKEDLDYTGNWTHAGKWAGGNNWHTITFNAGADTKGGGRGRGW